MSVEKVKPLFQDYVQNLLVQGMAKSKEKVITGIKASADGYGPRVYLEHQSDKAFLRMNSNSYLGLSRHPEVLAAETSAVEQYGTGPGAVRFISGTHQPHTELEQTLAEFHGREAAMIFSAAYAAVIGILPSLINEDTLVVSDELNHNCIINALRLARCGQKAVYPHLDLDALEQLLIAHKGRFQRVCVLSDGVFSMRGDHAPLDQIADCCHRHEVGYEQGIITVIDDSHGVAAFGQSGRGTEQVTGGRADILISTLGKALGVNGGYVVADRAVIAYLRETAATYIYSNPITPAEAAAAKQAVNIVDSAEGVALLKTLRELAERLRKGITAVGFETLSGEHPIIPIMIRDTDKTRALVDYLFAQKILVTGLNFPVVPKGQQEIRLQVSAEQTTKDIDYFLTALRNFN